MSPTRRRAKRAVTTPWPPQSALTSREVSGRSSRTPRHMCPGSGCCPGAARGRKAPLHVDRCRKPRQCPPRSRRGLQSCVDGERSVQGAAIRMTIELRASERRGIVEMRWCLRILSVRVLAGLLLNAPSGTIDPRRAEESWLTGHVVLGVGGLAVGGAACSPLALRRQGRRHSDEIRATFWVLWTDRRCRCRCRPVPVPVHMYRRIANLSNTK